MNQKLLTGQFNSEDYCIYICYIVDWRIKNLLLPHNLYSGAKHIPLSSQRPFSLSLLIGRLFIPTREVQVPLVTSVIALLYILYNKYFQKSIELYK